MARKMVTEYGMSERVGAIKLGQSQGEVFLGRDMGHQRDYSEEVASVVDEEVRRLIDSAHDEAWHVINDNREVLDRLVLDLLEHETLNAAELAEIFTPVKKRPLRPTWLSSETRLLSDQPPVLTPAEKAAQNGSAAGSAESADGQSATAQAIDEAANAGASDHPSEHPPTEVIEVPEGGRVDPDAKH
jgi:cell division protease FtsH